MKKKYTHICKGTCSKQVELTFDSETLKIIDVIVTGGCNGNLKGIRALLKGADMKESYLRLKDITCGPRSTSCPMQIALTIQEALKEENIIL